MTSTTTQTLAEWRAQSRRIHQSAQEYLRDALRAGTVTDVTRTYTEGLTAAAQEAPIAMTRYHAERPTLDLADDLFVSQACDYFRACHADRGPSWASEMATHLIEDRLAERQTGYPRMNTRFGLRVMRDHWDEVAASYRPQAVDIARLMRDGCWEDARCALAACMAAAESR